jgi:sugar lactone lactonase YvrE
MPEPGDVDVLAEGLAFPEGPVAMPDGSVVLVEVAAGRLTRVTPDKQVVVVAETGGGPNGAAVGANPEGTSIARGIHHVPAPNGIGLSPDGAVTNVCFGGPDLQTAYLTCSVHGRLVSCRWPRPGLRLAF